jgi:hypothetical protein
MFDFFLKTVFILFAVCLSIATVAASSSIPSALVAAITVQLYGTAPLTTFLSVWLPVSISFGIVFSVGFILDTLGEPQ